MKILIASTPGTGHLNPLLSIGRILMSEGHEVAAVSANAMRGRIEEIGRNSTPFPPVRISISATSPAWCPS